MSKLYPPTIDGVLPAFYGSTMTIPFQMNLAVGKNDIGGFQVKIKTVQSSSLIGTFLTEDYDLDNLTATFAINSDKILVGQYYKVQLAYIRNDASKTLGYYSTVGTIKYTEEPSLIIDDLVTTKNNLHQYSYTGIYSTSDISEKLYTYNYGLYDNNYNLILKSDDIIYNVNNEDSPGESSFSFIIKKELEDRQRYYLRLEAKTSNNLFIQSAYYPIVQKHTINSDAKIDLIADSVSRLEDGCIVLHMKGHNNPKTGIEEPVTGSFQLVRSDEKSDFTEWDEILRFNLYGQKPTQDLYFDYTIEQGVNYRYALIQYNQFGLYSNRIESNIVYSDFEHMYLYDGERQLIIKYNPKVSSFKESVMEQKTNTIGSKYPFIFKNGNVGSKEFSISGLIAIQMDETFLFIDKHKNVLSSPYRNDNTDKGMELYFENYSAYNMQIERDFKLEVLNWLNNGKPKLFRSAAEGNYMVRLMNTSLSPNDQLARRLHTFSSTAYEIDNVNFDTLKKYNLFTNINLSKESVGWMTVDFSKSGIYNTNKNVLKYKAIALKFEGMIPGDKVYINDGIKRPGQTKKGYTITIGATGQYFLDLDNNLEITEVKLASNSVDNVDDIDKMSRHQGILTYAYKVSTFNSFDTIKKFDIVDIPAQQFFGPQVHNLYDDINNIKINLQKIYYIHAILLPKDEWRDEGVAENNFYPKDTVLYLDGKEIDLMEIKDYLLLGPNIEHIQFGRGVLLEMGYQISERIYQIETVVGSKKLPAQTAYENKLQQLSVESTNEDIVNVKMLYSEFLVALEEYLKEQELIKGELV